MLVVTAVFWVFAFSVMLYFFFQEMSGLRRATRMKVREKLASPG